MKQIHLFLYGLLTGVVLILSTLLLIRHGHEASAQGAPGGAVAEGGFAMVATEDESGRHLVYTIAKNPDTQSSNMLLYTSKKGQLRLLSSRSMEYDRKVKDAYYMEPGKDNINVKQDREGKSVPKTMPAVSDLKAGHKHESEQDNKKGENKSSSDPSDD